MGWYADRVLPRLIDRALGDRTTGSLRERVCAGLTGEVVELGFGSGGNVPHYPVTVTGVAAVEPSDVAWRLAERRLRVSTVPVRRSDVDGQALSCADGTFDSALSSWTLCTIPDAAAALAEVHRVLRPGGTLHFVEHGLAPDERVRRWQHRLEPLQKRLLGGCHLTRPILDLVTGAGFTVTAVDVFLRAGRAEAVSRVLPGDRRPRLGRRSVPASSATGRPAPAGSAAGRAQLPRGARHRRPVSAIGLAGAGASSDRVRQRRLDPCLDVLRRRLSGQQ